MTTLLCLALWWVPGAATSAPITASTGNAEVVGGPTGWTALFSYEDLRYKAGAGLLPGPLAVERRPDGSSEGAYWGVLHLDAGLVAYVIDAPVEQGGRYRAWFDADRDGDLGGEREWSLDREGEWLTLGVPEELLGDPFELALPLGSNGLPMDYVRERAAAVRYGELEIAGRPLRFAVRATAGAWSRANVFFDLDGNGRIDVEDDRSDEAFTAAGDHVNIDGRSYAFAVGPRGRELRLSVLAEPRPARPRIDPGNAAPMFFFRDLDGTDRSLADYRGKVVLLFFWHAGCERCARIMPRLAEIYESHRDLGFEVIGITEDAEPAVVVATRAAAGAFWPQALEPADSPLLDLYRVDKLPTFVLIDLDGVVLSQRIRPDRLPQLLEPLLTGESPVDE